MSVVFVMAVVAGGFVLTASVLDRWTRHESREDRRHSTAFVPGPYRQTDYLLPYLKSLPPIDTLKPDGIRFLAKPELDELTYAVNLRLPQGGRSATGSLIVFRDPYQRPASKSTYSCVLPADAYVSLRQAIDERLNDFRGSDEFGTDGTDIVFELASERGIASGGGNFIEPYRGLGEIMLARLREGCVGAPLPEIGEDWYGCGSSEPRRCSIAARVRDGALR